MGIDGIDILKPDEFPGTKVRERKGVSRHEIETEYHTWVVGWDQPLQTFFLQRFDKGDTQGNVADIWLGGTPQTKMYEVEDLVQAAAKNGLVVDHAIQVKLYGDKDDGA